MTHAQQMLQTHPSSVAVDASTLVECIEACYDCAQSCTACADACLGEDDPSRSPAASDSTSTAPMSARPRDASSRVRRPSRCRWRGRPCRPARKLAAFAVRSVRSTPPTMSIAGCAPKLAGAAKKPAKRCSKNSEWPVQGCSSS
jgi:hypothetical protein